MAHSSAMPRIFERCSRAFMTPPGGPGLRNQRFFGALSIPRHTRKCLEIIDIDRWRSPVADQYGIGQLPTLLLYDGDGLITDDTREVLNALQR